MDVPSDLFNNEDFKQQFNSLPEEQKKVYRDAGEYMYEKDYEASSGNPQEVIDMAIDSLTRAFRCGLMPSQLSDEEVTFVKGLYGEDWYSHFGFTASDYTGIEVKKTSDLSSLCVFYKNTFSNSVNTLTPLEVESPIVTVPTDTPVYRESPETSNVPTRVYSQRLPERTKGRAVVSSHTRPAELTDASLESLESVEDGYDKHQAGYVYTVWS